MPSLRRRPLDRTANSPARDRRTAQPQTGCHPTPMPISMSRGARSPPPPGRTPSEDDADRHDRLHCRRTAVRKLIPLRPTDDVGQQGKGPASPPHLPGWRHVPGDVPHAGCTSPVSFPSTWLTDVDNGRTGFHHVRGHHVRHTHGGDDDVGLPGQCRQIASSGVATTSPWRSAAPGQEQAQGG